MSEHDALALLTREDAGAHHPRAGIAAIGTALPDGVVSSERIAARLGVDREWVTSRTGVLERRHAAPGVTLAEIGAEAAASALANAGLDAGDVDLILVATSTADDRVPNAAPLIAERLGAVNAGAIDVGAACTGFLSALELAAGAIESGRAELVVVIGAELMSRVLDLDDPRTAGLFGDGAGAAVVVPGGAARIGAVRLFADGTGARAVTASQTENLVRMDGRATFRAAVRHLAEVSLEVVADAGLELDEIDLFVYHQANGRILSAVGDRLGLPSERVVDSIATHGNTSAASIPLALAAALADGRIEPGSRILLGAFGAGFTWGGAILEWS
ncbi:MAG: 3-oxoacyl-[acyl-carrier-protein] synthase [Solirubrobacterales bacterium]|jgi:3-oxoacyl-[acyl-carrier-protein] synthase-3|nr:3-oxoacyl-[acyl-carrier-protein] synthase [Solirubrobacterales bacterium]